MTKLAHATSDDEILRCFPVMAELRSHLRQESFVDLIRQLMAEGYRLAYLEEGDQIVATAGYRISTSLFLGKNLYIDDLVTSAQVRSRGYGQAMLAQLREIAIQSDCAYLHLDSGVQRRDAHRFYFREGLTVSCFHFEEELGD